LATCSVLFLHPPFFANRNNQTHCSCCIPYLIPTRRAAW
jgi:hypothetical protein